MENQEKNQVRNQNRWKHRGSQILIASMVAAGLLIPVGRALTYEIDHGFANLISGLLSILILLLLFVWFLFFRGLSWLARIGLVMVPCAILLMVVTKYEFRGFSGEMIPQFRLRTDLKKFSSSDTSSDSTLSEPQWTGDRSASSTQLLGPFRNGNIPGIQLARDWSNDPPKIVWSQDVGDGWAGMAVSEGRLVTLEQLDENEFVTCYDLGSGRILWNHRNQGRHYELLGGLGPRSTPTIDGDRVYALGATGILQCLKLASGEVIWSKELLQIMGMSKEDSEMMVKWGRAASPLVYQQNVIVPCGGPKGEMRSLIAFRREDGEVVWRQGEDQISYASPMPATICGEEMILSVNENTFTGHFPLDGKMAFSFPWPGASNGAASCSQPLVISEDKILISKGYGGGAVLLQCMRQEKGFEIKELWRDSSLLRTKFTNAVLRGDHAYGLSDGILECVQVTNGKRAWKKGRYGHGQVLLVDDLLLISSESGDVVLVEATPQEHRELARMHVLDGVTWNIPTLASDHLIIRNGSKMVCLKLPTK